MEGKVRQQQGAPEKTVNQLSVKLELQADCFAGEWGHSMQQRQILDEQEVQEALNAAQAIGDDHLQQRGQGRVVPGQFYPWHLPAAL